MTLALSVKPARIRKGQVESMLPSANDSESRRKFILDRKGLEELAGIVRRIKQKILAADEHSEGEAPQPSGPDGPPQDPSAVRGEDSQGGGKTDDE